MANAFARSKYHFDFVRRYWNQFHIATPRSSRRSQVSRAAIERLEVGTLVIVAGASGAGKSTFLELFAAGLLPASIASTLPPGCANWLQTNGKKVIGQSGRDLSLRNLTRVEGALQHYDILSPFDTAVESYETDAALALASRAERIVVVDIRPGVEALRAHLAERLTFRLVPPFLSRLIGRRLALRAGAGLEGFPDLHRLTGNILAPRRVRDRQRWNKRYAMLRDLYEQDDWLNGWYRRWDNYIKTSAGARLDQVIYVTPEEGAPSPSFRLNGIFHRDSAAANAEL